MFCVQVYHTNALLTDVEYWQPPVVSMEEMLRYAKYSIF